MWGADPTTDDRRASDGEDWTGPLCITGGATAGPRDRAGLRLRMEGSGGPRRGSLQWPSQV